MVDRDRSLDVLFELDGTVLVIDATGHRVEFDVKLVEPSRLSPPPKDLMGSPIALRFMPRMANEVYAFIDSHGGQR